MLATRLLRHGIAVEASRDGDTQSPFRSRPLHEACASGQLRLVRWLIEDANANPHARCDTEVLDGLPAAEAVTALMLTQRMALHCSLLQREQEQASEHGSRSMLASVRRAKGRRFEKVREGLRCAVNGL